jgi:RimJ/RimL family protein N-acetyltransferase
MTPRAPERVETPRMRGERLGPQHLDALAPILADPRVGATMGGVRTREEVTEQLDAEQERWDRDGMGYWMFVLRASGEAVGRGGLSRAVFDGRDVVEVGWTVAPERWGQGLATELGAAAVAVAFEGLGLPDVVAYTLPHNGASRRVMEKLGFAYEKTAPYKVYGDHVLYRLRPGT